MKNIIYALSDPNDGLIYYVGKSEVGLERAYSHTLSHNSEVSKWLKRIGECVVMILEHDLDPELLTPKERYWINEMMRRKHPLFNKLIPVERQLKYHDYQVGKFVKEQRRKANLTQKEFALKAGLGLRFVRDLEQGKETCRLDKVLQALQMFGATLIPIIK